MWSSNNGIIPLLPDGFNAVQNLLYIMRTEMDIFTLFSRQLAEDLSFLPFGACAADLPYGTLNAGNHMFIREIPEARATSATVCM